MPLNDAFDFARRAEAGHQAAFTRRFGVQRMLVRAGTELVKLTGKDLAPHDPISPWWNFLRPTTVPLAGAATFVVPGWETVQARARGIGASDEAFGRARSAVTRQWNPMTQVVRARLNVDAYGWFGQNSGMPLDNSAPDPRSVMLIGGAYQVYIPNLLAGMMTQF